MTFRPAKAFEDPSRLHFRGESASGWRCACEDLTARDSTVDRSLGRLAASSDPIGVSGPYRLGPGDVVQITVFEVDELSQPAVVGSQGSIPLPLVGEVNVEGLTTSEIEGRGVCT